MDNCKLNVKHSVYATVCGYFFNLLVILVGELLIMFCYSIFTGKQLSTNFFTNNAWGYLVSVIFLNLALIGTFIFFNKGKQNKIVQKVKISKLAIYALVAIAALFMLMPLINCLDVLFAKTYLPVSKLNYNLNTKNFLISIISIAIIPPICEELLFRGLIFKGLKGYGKAFSVFFSALFFALFHTSVNQFIYPILMGCLYAVIMYKENNIIYTITMHIINNFLSLLFMYLKLPFYVNHWAYILLSIVLAIIFIAVIICLMIKNNKGSKTINIKENVWYLIAGIVIMIVIMILTTILSITG